MRRSSLIFAALLVWLSSGAPVRAQVPAETVQGQEYVVQQGDYLRKIAAAFYGAEASWALIVWGTNLKAGGDESFQRINESDMIYVGQKLWIPDASLLTPTCLERFGPRYCTSILDAASADPWEAAPELVAITPDNSNLVWLEEGGERKVLVATWTSWNGYDASISQPFTQTREVWVTAAPEVQEFCREYRRTNPGHLVQRLEQLLGVPANSGKNRFVEFWARPEDLFRPATNPAIDTVELQPADSQSAAAPPDYEAWFSNLQSTSYTADTPYPWTRLGYTYDWGDVANPVGASEFIIKKGSVVTVKGVYGNEEYCQ